MSSTRILFSPHRSPLVSLSRMLQGASYHNARFFIFADSHTTALCLPRLVATVKPLQEALFFELPTGEEAKNIEVAVSLWQALLESGANRDSVIINLGGGSISDIGGFVAATYQRGIRYINVPTTLLAMVDAAIGGKTALDLAGVKNQVGLFHWPDAVCIDPSFLETLSQHDLLSGRYEMLKTLLIAPPEAGLGDWDIALDTVPDKALISACAHFKMAVCHADPYDRSVRRILNFGHTFGHALETWRRSNNNPVSHGEAVAMGMWCSIWLSVRKLNCPSQLLDRYTSHVGSHLSVPAITLRDTETLLELMRCDKKNSAHQQRIILLKAAGVPVIDVEVSENEIRDTLLQLHHQLGR